MEKFTFSFAHLAIAVLDSVRHFFVAVVRSSRIEIVEEQAC